jgi:hypothetical protein
VYDPRVAVELLTKAGKIDEGRLFEIDELLEDLHQQPISKASVKGKKD